MNAVMNLQVPYKVLGNYREVAPLMASGVVLNSMELVG
jgi:hypothetical protein